ncbi:protein MpGCS1 [Marchantia polymorpha subsp. ruderalis]
MEKSSDGTSCLRTGSRIILYLVLLLFPVFEKVKSDALLSSWLVNCTRHQHEKVEKEIDCIKKMLLHFSIDNGKSGESDTIETFVTQVREYNGGSRDLEEPYRITMYKSDIYVQYPLQFLQSFNGNPHEVESFAHNCKDDSKDKTPNCGWLYNKAGEKVKDSQGFCCLCTVKDKLPPWLGGESLPRRSKQDCNSTLLSFLNLLPWRRRGSAHCLRYSTQWYPTYQVGLSNQTFTIRIKTDLAHSSREVSSLSQNFDSVEVTSHLRVDINSRRTMKGKLQAFSIMNTEPPDLADQYLSIPYEKGKIDLTTNTSKWLTLPKSFYTLDGRDCDKIGISHSAFRLQPQPCNHGFQSCCSNQLDKFAKDESERLANGETPLYAVSRHGKVFASHQTHNSTLNLLTNQTVTSLLTLEVKADDLKYFVHRSPGKIMEASFESTQTHLSGGLLKVEILNAGKKTANFTLHTEECPLLLNFSTVEVRSLKPRNTLSSFTFNVSETDDSSYFSTCKVFLQDNMGDKTDTFEVKLDYPSRDELAFLLRAEATGTNSKNSSSLFNWIYSLFNYTKWFGVFNTTFNFCWFSCPKNTLESESSTGGQSTFRCEYSSQTIPDLDENGFTAKCPDAPGTPTGSGNFSLYNIFTWTPCGECSNIVLDFKCYVTTLCWKEILSFVMYVIAAIILIYFAWLLHQAGILGPIISTVLSFIAMICKLLCGCLTILFGGRRSGGGEGSSSDGDNDGGGSRGRRKKRKRKRKKKWKRKRHKKRKWW